MMATLSGICSKSCSCSEETRSLKGAQFFQITQREETPCAETTTCSGCDVFSRHLGLCALMARAHSSKNSHMTQPLASSTALHQIYTLAMCCQLSPAERVQRKTKVKDLRVKSLTARGTDCSAWSISASWPSCCQNFCVSSWSQGTFSSGMSWGKWHVTWIPSQINSQN